MCIVHRKKKKKASKGWALRWAGSELNSHKWVHWANTSYWWDKLGVFCAHSSTSSGCQAYRLLCSDGSHSQPCASCDGLCLPLPHTTTWLLIYIWSNEVFVLILFPDFHYIYFQLTWIFWLACITAKCTSTTYSTDNVYYVWGYTTHLKNL